jgi:hypothetical protein
MGHSSQHRLDSTYDKSSHLRYNLIFRRRRLQYVLCRHGFGHGARWAQVSSGRCQCIQLLLCSGRIAHARLRLHLQRLSRLSHLHCGLFHCFRALILARSRVAAILDYHGTTSTGCDYSQENRARKWAEIIRRGDYESKQQL